MSSHAPKTNGQQNRARVCHYCGRYMRKLGIWHHIKTKHPDGWRGASSITGSREGT